MDKWAIRVSLALVLTGAGACTGARAGNAADVAPAATDAGGNSAAVDAATDTDMDNIPAAYERNERALYDTLVADPSPTRQVLSGSLYIADDDSTPTALRPKREDVVARAVELAPDDAFVQSIAAANSSYQSSSCGPTQWPDAAVANLLRLEPDNAGAWRFGVALAFAKGDQAGVDDALSRMAAATRADDHAVDEIAAWSAVFSAHPELVFAPMSPYKNLELKPADKARLAALGRLEYRTSHVKSALQRACTPDAASDGAWRRIGWCADAGRLLAEKGSSIELRGEGLALLAAVGDHSDDAVAAEREHDWFEAHKAYPVAEFEPAKLSATLADWDGALSEVAAIRQRLKRLDLPSTPPAAWVRDADPSAADSAATAKAMKQYADYMSAVFADMRASSSPEQRIAAALNESVIDAITAAARNEAEPTVGAKSGGEAIAALATENAGNVRIQWMIASASSPEMSDETKATAIATVQQAESDNAAAWELSLEPPSAATGALADTLLQRMASSTHFDSHPMYSANAFLDALRQRPAPPELMATFVAKLGNKASPELAARLTALGMVFSGMTVPIGAMRACAPAKDTTMQPSRRDACIAIGHLLVYKAPTVVGVRFGESILRKLGALDAAESERARQVMWWQSTMSGEAFAGDIDADYLSEFVTSGNEVDALHHFAESRGKADPPADWTPRRSSGAQ